MFDKNVDLPQSDSHLCEPNSFHQFNAHVNTSFQLSPGDHELKRLDRSDSTKVSRIMSRVKRKLSNETIRLGHAESLYSLRLSIKPKLETVVRWTNLKVKVNVKGIPKKILDNVSGEINNLETIAILGPSGAGKSTLLNAIAGQIKDYDGDVNFYSNDKKITFAFVPQVDQLAEYLTVVENLLFASKLKNSSDANHMEEIEFTLKAINLWDSRNNLTSRCSGGERKRLSIALEMMISRPEILLLDEPTSGLDSTTSYVLIEYLKNIKKNTTVLTTIHQPNSHLFQLFDRCYILTDGRCIYDGTPSGMVDHLKANFGLTCHEFTSPADYILDIANGVRTAEGLKLIDKLANYEEERNEKRKLKSGSNGDQINSATFIDPLIGEKIVLKAIDRSSFNDEAHFFNEFYQILKRLFISNLRDPQQIVFRIFSNLFFPLVLYLIMNRRAMIGSESGCRYLPSNETHILTEKTYERLDRQLVGFQNASSVFINFLFLLFISLTPATLALSQHINLLKKEFLNSYYTIKSFFAAVIASNMLLGLIYSLANSVSFFYFSYFAFQFDKFTYFWFIVFLLNNIGDLFGFFLAICYPEEKNKIAALVLSSFSTIILHLFSGFVINFNLMTYNIEKLSWFVFCRHTIAAAMKILFGNRCKLGDHLIFGFQSVIDFVKHYNTENEDKLEYLNNMPLKVRTALEHTVWNRTTILKMVEITNDLNDDAVKKINDFWEYNNSYLLNTYQLNDSDITENLQVLFMTIFLLVSLCYFVLIYKIRK